MPAPTLPDNKEDQKLNPGQQDYDRRFNDIVSNSPEYPDTAQGLKDLENTANGSSDSDKSVRESEQAPDSAPSSYTNNYSGNNPKSRRQKVLGFIRKRGGIIGLIAGLGIGGGALAGFFGPAGMLINLSEQLSITNDSSSTSFERRFMKMFAFSTSPTDPICKESTKNIKCKMGRISNKALDQLEKKGVKPFFNNEGDANNRKSTGYPKENPSGYSVDLGDGEGMRNIKIEDLFGFLADNPKFAAKILGTKGAFNVRFKAWSSKYMASTFYKAFGIKRDGGMADGKNKRLSPADTLKESLAKLRDRIPGAEKINAVADGVKAKVNKQVGSAKKGGAAYTLMVAGCIGVKAPGFIAAGVAGVQLAQMLPIVSDVILSPGSKAKASGVSTANPFTSEDMNAIGTLLTNRTPRASDGKMTSALDSPSLLSALGVNKGKPAVSQKFAPGISILSNPAIRAANAADEASEPACNAIMSPAAMYTAMAVEAAATIALSATVVGGLGKVVAGWAVGEIVTGVATEVAGAVASGVITDLAENDAIQTAEGEELGDVLGVSASAFFSAGGMAHHLPVLKESQVAPFQAMQQENEDFQRDMDIASLSPFDTSSKYTFLGSMVNSARLAVLSSGSYDGGLFSIITGLGRAPLSALTMNAGAASFTDESCSYADEFRLTAPETEEAPAINQAGLPCTGITAEQAAMSTNESIDLVVNEGWLDETRVVKDSATIEDLVDSGYIKSDTPLYDAIESCSDASSGDYLFNSTGCTVSSNSKSIDSTTLPEDVCTEDDVCASESVDLPSAPTVAGVKDARSLTAIAPFLIDFQLVQSTNGEDEDDGEDESSGATGDFVLPTDPGYSLPGSLGDWGSRSCSGCSTYHRGIDIRGGAGGAAGKPVYAIGEGEVIMASKTNGSGSSCTTGSGGNNTVQIKLTNGLIAEYMHMRPGDIAVGVGDKVQAGQLIGKIGNCGQSTGAHLHFGILIGEATDDKILAIGGSDASGKYRNPASIMALFGVDITNGKYTDGR